LDAQCNTFLAGQEGIRKTLDLAPHLPRTH
jgi:hypothetical protein